MARREKVYKQGLADPRTGPERLMGLAARALSPDKKQGRRWDDDDATRRRNVRETEERVARKRRKKRGS